MDISYFWGVFIVEIKIDEEVAHVIMESVFMNYGIDGLHTFMDEVGTQCLSCECTNGKHTDTCLFAKETQKILDREANKDESM